ncbi:hypothetical protein SPRG_15497 [Saprolegnia parasitica CBS 223.65]|uniref:Uncharacterized protein n=1 Tax=Saprolegnia parasitica (strain CBS 223.65) TaxID=695850 RepID=A0A067BXW1_SAPPC|nr:hypothetical protein SPRG_15497 [Saprolegnia parasitica CBS 223.65]KDO19417.1 hypothetical protein SPRG_15497 [Saprolegnia parasitica CBS 223.65]|eukprot:XP_012209884.1 hypothetical protein SPRG_15497 [Saprolegnia parasitica CBS 223.65]
MRSQATAAVLSLLSLGCLFAATLSPTWLAQSFESPANVRVHQGFGLFGFSSTVENAPQLTTPFLASTTYVSYGALCATDFAAPNWMYGTLRDYQSKLCDVAWTLTHVLHGLTLALNLVALTFNLRTLHTLEWTAAETIAGLSTMANGFLQLCVLMLWSLQLKPSISDIGLVHAQLVACATWRNWSCWGFGPSFYLAASAVLWTLLTFSAISSGRRHKIRRQRKEAVRRLLDAPQSPVASSYREPRD